MAYYRLYFHDKKGRILRAEEAVVDDDAQALAEARKRNHADCIEVWQEKRMVGVVEPANDPRRDC